VSDLALLNDKMNSEAERLEGMLSAATGLCRQLTTLQKSVMEGNSNIVQISDVVAAQAKSLESALQQYHSTVKISFDTVTKEIVSHLREELNLNLNKSLDETVNRQITPQINNFILTQEEKLQKLEQSAEETREVIDRLNHNKSSWKYFAVLYLSVLVVGISSAVITTAHLIPNNIFSLDDVKLSEMVFGKRISDSVSKMTKSEKSTLTKMIDDASSRKL